MATECRATTRESTEISVWKSAASSWPGGATPILRPTDSEPARDPVSIMSLGTLAISRRFFLFILKIV